MVHVREGKYHQVRRMMASRGMPVTYLERVREGGLTLGDLPRGQVRELTEEELSQLRTAAGEMSAKMRAVRIISASGVSKKDLEQRLIHKGENPEQAKNAVQWLSEMDLLDDEKTAQQVVSQCIRKGYGLNRAKQALYEKRIPREFWESALEDYPEQTDAIVEFLKNRLGKSRDAKEVRKATDALIRRGHSYGQIRKGLEILSLDNEFLEEF